MNIVKNGESSTSPLRHAVDLAANGSVDDRAPVNDKSNAPVNASRSGRLVLPQWDGMFAFLQCLSERVRY